MTTATAISNTDDIIDSRDVIARIEELTTILADCDHSAPGNNSADCDLWAEHDEYNALTALAEEAEGSPDWQYGETLIRDTYFREYAEELANDCGMVDPKLANSWPYTHIDWEAAAEALKADYFEVDFDGVSYWIRA